MNKKVHYGIMLLAVFLMLLIIFTPKAFADTYPTWKEVDGKKYYYYSEYNKAIGSVLVDGKRYVFDKNGVMQKGWYDDQYTYYEGEEKHISHNWYYANPTTGELLLGSQKVNGTWYYFATYSGRMINNGTAIVDGKVYLYGNSGAWVTKKGWNKVTYDSSSEDASWYYIGNDGACYEGWQVIGGNDYYFFPESGRMADRPSSIEYNSNGDTRIYCFNKSGKWISNPGKWWSYTESYGTTSWYYFGNTRYAKTGWQNVDNIWYYFDEYDGIMATSPTRIYKDENNSQVWCFASSGAWIANPNGWYSYEEKYSDGETNVAWYHFTNGEADSGITEINGKKYFFSSYNGRMATGRQYVNLGNNQWTYYYFGEDGVMLTNSWYKDDYTSGGKDIRYYYFDENGELVKGWKKIGSTWYWFDGNGLMASNRAIRVSASNWNESPKNQDYEHGETYEDYCNRVDIYAFGSSGAMIANGWFEDKYTWTDSKGNRHEESEWYYLSESGKAVKNGWRNINGAWYCFNPDGRMVSNTIITVSAEDWNSLITDPWSYDGNYDVYAFSKSGNMVRNGWFEDKFTWEDSQGNYNEESKWYYLSESGKAIKGWKNINGTWYFFGKDGRMASNEVIRVLKANWNELATEPDWEHNESWEDYSKKVNTYAFSKSGAMIRNNWFEEKYTYYDENGAEQVSSITWYYLSESGAAITGWKFINGTWYWFDYDGRMASNRTIKVSSSNWNELATEPDWEHDESWDDWCNRIDIYAFGENGAMISNGWFVYSDSYSDFTEAYYLGANGKALKKQWIQGSTGLWYYLSTDGRMLANEAYNIGDKTYVFNRNGAMFANGWASVIDYYHEWDSETQSYKSKTFWYYTSSSGAVCKGLTKVGNKYYFFDENHGEMRENFMYTDEVTHKTYIFGSDGEQLFNSWYEDTHEEYIDGQSVTVTRYLYVDENGDLVSGWREIDGKTYYFNDYDHARVTGIQEIDGKTYEFDNDGALIGEITQEPEVIIDSGVGTVIDPSIGSQVPETDLNNVEVLEKSEEDKNNENEIINEEQKDVENISSEEKINNEEINNDKDDITEEKVIENDEKTSKEDEIKEEIGIIDNQENNSVENEVIEEQENNNVENSIDSINKIVEE